MGRAVDAALTAQYHFDSGGYAAGGYRTLEGGADNYDVYTFAWLLCAGHRRIPVLTLLRYSRFAGQMLGFTARKSKLALNNMERDRQNPSAGEASPEAYLPK